MAVLRLDHWDACLRWDLRFHSGEAGSTLVVGELGTDTSTMPRSKTELRRGFDWGEVGAEDGANSEGISDIRDQRPAAVEVES